MLKLIMVALLGLTVWITGTWGYVLIAFICWEFFKGARRGGGASGGIQAVVLKTVFAGMVYFALQSPMVHGAVAAMIGLAGGLGLLIRQMPTFKSSKDLQKGMAAGKIDDAVKSLSDAQAKLAISSGVDDKNKLGAAHEHIDDAMHSSSEKNGQDARGGANSGNQGKGKGGGKKQGTLNWFLYGSNGSKGSQKQGKQSFINWFFCGSQPKQNQAGGGVLAWFLYGKPMKKKSKNPIP